MPNRPASPPDAKDRDGSGSAPVLRVHTAPTDLDARAWNALLDASPHPTPFMRHEWLTALHLSGCAVPQRGWTPLFLTLDDEAGRPRAGCALYAKTHSYGEYVFDWAWARALQQAGQAYYPKLLCASPFTPVPGSRLLAPDADARIALLRGMQALAQAQGWSSAHLLFMDEADREAAAGAGWLLRSTVQFHWTNERGGDGGRYTDFADFLAGLQRDKRKKIQQERRRVREAGITIRTCQGPDIAQADWDLFHACYVRTYEAHHSEPYLNRRFFAEVARTLPNHWLMFVAQRDGRDIATSLIGLDPRQRVAYGRYWGALEAVPCLHFELCYYQPLQWCIDHAWRRFEGGAQGEHKMARGLLPTRTWSAHWLAHAGLAQAVARFLEAESEDIGAYVDELDERSPFKSTPLVSP